VFPPAQPIAELTKSLERVHATVSADAAVEPAAVMSVESWLTHD